MKFLCIFFTLFALSGVASAQQQHYVAFCSTTNGTAGHAFVAIGYEDTDLGMTVYDGSWGKYPEPDASAWEKVYSKFGPVPGEIRDDALEQVNHRFVVEANSEEYQMVAALIQEQQAYPNDFSLTEGDCVGFVIQAAKIFEKRIRIPKRNLTAITPNRYIERLILLNRTEE